MDKTRLEAFSDAVIAIIMTVMVLELKIPHGADLEALKPLLPVFLAYILSFLYLGIYWNNHHHMLQATRTVNGKVLWANLLLLFWLSLVLYLIAICLAFVQQNISHFIYLLVALIWFIPDRRIERRIAQ